MNYTDPNFWQIISIISAVLIMFFTLYAQRSNKSLVFAVNETPLISIDDEIKEKLEIKLDGTAVKNVHLIVIRVWNNGNAPITTTDFDKPLKFTLSEKVKILNPKILGKKPATLEPEFKLTSPNQLTIEPLLLNKQDSFTIKFLATEYVGGVAVHGRINGVKDLKQVSSVFASFKWQIPLFIILLGTGILIISIATLSEWLSQGTQGVFSVFGSVLVALLGISASLKGWLDLFKEQDKK